MRPEITEYLSKRKKVSGGETEGEEGEVAGSDRGGPGGPQ